MTYTKEVIPRSFVRNNKSFAPIFPPQLLFRIQTSSEEWNYELISTELTAIGSNIDIRQHAKISDATVNEAWNFILRQFLANTGRRQRIHERNIQQIKLIRVCNNNQNKLPKGPLYSSRMLTQLLSGTFNKLLLI